MRSNRERHFEQGEQCGRSRMDLNTFQAQDIVPGAQVIGQGE